MRPTKKKTPKNQRSIRTRGTLPEFVEGDLPETIDVTPDPEEESLDRIVAQFGSGLVVKVYKIEQGQRGYICTIDKPQGMTEETIRELGWGGGRYLLHFYKDGELRDDRDVVLLDKPTQALAKSAPASELDSPLMKLLMQQMADLQKLIFAMIQGGGNREQTPMGELATALKELHSMTANQKELPSDMLMKALEMGVAIAGAGKADDTLLGTLKDIAKEFAPHLIPALLNKGPAPAQVAAPPQPQPTIASQPQMTADDIKLKAGLTYLKTQCMKQLDPLIFVDLIGANADSEPYAALIRRVLTSDFSAFEAIDADLKAEPYHAFFVAIFNGLRSAFASHDPVDDDSSGEGGDSGNAS